MSPQTVQSDSHTIPKGKNGQKDTHIKSPIMDEMINVPVLNHCPRVINNYKNVHDNDVQTILEEVLFIAESHTVSNPVAMVVQF